MLDFLMISTRPGKRGTIEIYPRFLIGKSSDLMIRGGDFYAVWIEEEKRWSTNEDDVTTIVDKEIEKYYEEHKHEFVAPVKLMRMRFSDTGIIDTWHKYCQKQMRDNFHMLDERIIFSNMEPKKKDYASKRLSYPLEPGECPAYEHLMSTLYAPDEREKLEWAVGAIVCGASKELQNPTRTLTTTIKVDGGVLPLVPVKTAGEVPKASLLQCMEVVRRASCTAPVKRGDILLYDLLGTGINVIACADVDKE